MEKAATHPVVYAVLGGALLWLGLRRFERANLYFPDRRLTANPYTFGLAYEEARFAAADGAELHGWFAPGDADGPVLLLCHGNGGNISHRVEKLRILRRRLGASALLFDYRGYGLSSGRPSERGTYLDAEAAYDYLRGRGIPPGRIVPYGESLGCAVALELALRRPVRALVLESPFTSVPEMARLVLPLPGIGRLVRFRYDNLAKMTRLERPLLILHSPEDEIVPFEMGLRLFAAARVPKELAKLRGGHNDGYLLDEENYAAALGGFLRAYASAEKSPVRTP